MYKHLFIQWLCIPQSPLFLFVSVDDYGDDHGRRCGRAYSWSVIVAVVDNRSSQLLFIFIKLLIIQENAFCQKVIEHCMYKHVFIKK